MSLQPIRLPKIPMKYRDIDMKYAIFWRAYVAQWFFVIYIFFLLQLKLDQIYDLQKLLNVP